MGGDYQLRIYITDQPLPVYNADTEETDKAKTYDVRAYIYQYSGDLGAGTGSVIAQEEFASVKIKKQETTKSGTSQKVPHYVLQTGGADIKWEYDKKP